MTDSALRWTLPLDGNHLPEKSLIGGKAWSLARMRALGLPVPPAFVITTRACAEFLATGEMPDGLLAEIREGLRGLEAETGRSFGGGDVPLLVSVRSGAMISMPGMMDTVLNLGMNDATEGALAHESGIAAFARDTHRRFLELYARIVLRGTLEDLAHDAEIEPDGKECSLRALECCMAGGRTEHALDLGSDRARART